MGPQLSIRMMVPRGMVVTWQAKAEAEREAEIQRQREVAAEARQVASAGGTPVGSPSKRSGKFMGAPLSEQQVGYLTRAYTPLCHVARDDVAGGPS